MGTSRKWVSDPYPLGICISLRIDCLVETRKLSSTECLLWLSLPVHHSYCLLFWPNSQIQNSFSGFPCQFITAIVYYFGPTRKYRIPSLALLPVHHSYCLLFWPNSQIQNSFSGFPCQFITAIVYYFGPTRKYRIPSLAFLASSSQLLFTILAQLANTEFLLWLSLPVHHSYCLLFWPNSQIQNAFSGFHCQFIKTIVNYFGPFWKELTAFFKLTNKECLLWLSLPVH